MSIKCEQCGKESEGYYFLSFRKHNFDGERRTVTKHLDFCSKKCAETYIAKAESLEGMNLFKITRCVGYYDCDRLDNLRVMCEDEEALKGRGGSIYSIINGMTNAIDSIIRAKSRTCNPSDVAIIKASLKMMDMTEKFNESSTKLSNEMIKHTKGMNRLTKWILGFTIANAIIIILSIILTLIRR